MIPIKLTNDTWPPKDGEFCSSIVLYYDNWNDYSYRTSFVMCYCDADGMVREVGNVKIYYWQNDEVRTNQYILELFDGNLSLNALIFLKSCYMGGD